MKTYTKSQILKAAEIGEVCMIDARYVVSLLDEAVEEMGEITHEETISDEEIEPILTDKEINSAFSVLAYHSSVSENDIRAAIENYINIKIIHK